LFEFNPENAKLITLHFLD